ncbi:MAG: hypothetical protein J6H20_08690, partial [Pyramidobacter sp.]|nr:hypothetical protein [Pyramidobacter sp.]
HVDHTEHDAHVIITEYGLADLRCKTAYERAELLIENCAHPRFRPALREFVARQYAKKGHCHGFAPEDLILWQQAVDEINAAESAPAKPAKAKKKKS